MSKDLPTNLNLIQWNTKVPDDALKRLKALHAELGEAHGARMSDILSACIMLVDKETLIRRLDEMRAVEDATPKVIKDLIRGLAKMTDEERETALKLLS